MSVKKSSEVAPPKPYPEEGVRAYIGSLFDNPELSDFVLKSSYDLEAITSGEAELIGSAAPGVKNSKLYLHKLILSASPYFKNFFASPVGGVDKSEMTIASASLETIKIVAKFFYYGKISCPDTIEPHDFMSLCDLVEMWMLPASAKVTLFQHAQKHWKNIMDTNILYGDSLLLYFENHPVIEVLTYYTWLDKPLISKWDGKMLKYELVKYVSERVDTIVDLDVAKGALFRLLSVDQWLNVFVRLGAYGDIPLNTIPPSANLQDLSNVMNDYYDPKSKIFTPKQLSALKRSNFIRGPKWNSPDTQKEDLTLKLFSLVPFSGVMFHYLGEITGKSKRYVAIFVTLAKDFRVTFIESLGIYNIRLYVDGIYVTFKSIYLDDQPVVDGECFAGTNYSFALADATEEYEPGVMKSDFGETKSNLGETKSTLGEPMTAEFLPSSIDVFWVEEF